MLTASIRSFEISDIDEANDANNAGARMISQCMKHEGQSRDLPTTQHEGAKYQPPFSLGNLKLPNQWNGKDKDSDISQNVHNARHKVLGCQVNACAMYR